MAEHNDIILFHYSFSPYARKIAWYLTLRNLPYSQSLQPPTLPRPILTSLGISYRRIPILSICRDIYCDTRLILHKLETLFPKSPLSPSTPSQQALQTLLSQWTTEAGIFRRAAQLIPAEMPLLNDTKFIKDREDYTGSSWAKTDITKMRPEALAHIREAFEFLETGLLADGKEWVLGTKKPMLADIEAIWPFHWLVHLKGALPAVLISATQYPKVFAWIARFNNAINAAKEMAAKPVTLKDDEAVKKITQAEFAEPEAEVDERDPSGLKKGQDVETWPIDSGFRHHERGRLVGLTKDEVVLEGKSESGVPVRIHHPRTGFRIRGAGKSGPRL